MTDKDLRRCDRLHILHHAAEEPVFGLGIIENYADGYRDEALAPCTRCCTAPEKRLSDLTPRTHQAAWAGVLYAEQGRTALADAKTKVKELFGEVGRRWLSFCYVGLELYPNWIVIFQKTTAPVDWA